jgi:regulator of protease activity HflC (stomatin/prohibitin superfamily)
MADAATEMRRTPERAANTTAGGFLLILAVLLLVATLPTSIAMGDDATWAIALTLEIVLFIFIIGGFYSLQPNEAAAIILFGNYKGTDRTTGLRWVPLWYRRKKISLRVRNVTGERLKVNDKRGSPIEIAAVLVWRVTETAAALFDVDHYDTFVNIQMETALREIASHFSYDHAEHEEPTLRADAELVSNLLREKLQERVRVAGIEIVDTKLSHLAYAPEIASAMLRRQQAEAIIGARAKIVEGAVSMVERALNQLSERGIVALDDERRAAMVSNLLVVLCADREAQPVLNTGTIYP